MRRFGVGHDGVAADAGAKRRMVLCSNKFRLAVYVLHAFQKKSKKGIKTPRAELDLVEKRLRKAGEHYEENYEGEDR